MIGVSFSSSVSIWPAMVRWLLKSRAATYYWERLSYSESLKCAAFHEPVPNFALVV